MEDSRIDDLIEQVQALTLQVASLEKELRRRNGTSPTPSVVESVVRSEFAEGDRVRILNVVKKPATWDNAKRWSEAQAKTATVTKVRAGQIFFRTDNGVSTWRAPNNLRKIQQDE
jgi:hypothetical protein